MMTDDDDDDDDDGNDDYRHDAELFPSSLPLPTHQPVAATPLHSSSGLMNRLYGASSSKTRH